MLPCSLDKCLAANFRAAKPSLEKGNIIKYMYHLTLLPSKSVTVSEAQLKIEKFEIFIDFGQFGYLIFERSYRKFLHDNIILIMLSRTQQTFTSSKSTTETLVKGAKYVQI